MNHPTVPKTRFLHEINTLPNDLENYVLKPLFSFAGSGVKFDVTREDLEQVKDPENHILMEKVKYEPVLRAADGGGVKTEIRVLFLSLNKGEELKPVVTVVRLSRGKMIGVDFNKDKTWVGGSVGFFE